MKGALYICEKTEEWRLASEKREEYGIMPPMNVMIKPASGLCNMRCAYCFYTDEMSNREQESYGVMTTETLEKVMEKTLAFAEIECTIAYQGGEPTLAGLDFFKKAAAFQETYNVNKVKIHNALQTNGYALDEEWCRFLKEQNFLVGISLDGIKATHDCHRKSVSGEDTFFRVRESIRMLEEAGVEFNILTVVNGRTAPKIRRIYEQYEKWGLRYQQYIACLDPIGVTPGKQPYSLTPAAYGQFLIDLFALWDMDLRQGKQPYIRLFENYIALLIQGRAESCEQNGICGQQNIVEADGSVYPCDFYVLDEYRLGNLRTDSFAQIYEKRKALRFQETSVSQSESCRKCRYFPVCRGGCRRHRDNAGVIADNYFCESYRMFFDRYYERLQEIAAACMRGRRR